MRRLDRYLLPILTCLVVLVAILFPQRLSRWRDEAELNGPHTEELKTENDLPTQPLSLEERILLLAVFTEYGESPDMTVILQEQGWNDETEALMRAELERLRENGVLPLMPEGLLGFSVQRCWLRAAEEIRGAAFLIMNVRSKAEGVWLSMILDEETGYALTLEASGSAVKLCDAEPVDTGILFLDRLGLEYACDGYAENDAGFTLTGTECSYIVVKDQGYLRVSPWTPYGSESISVAIDRGGSGQTVHPTGQGA